MGWESGASRAGRLVDYLLSMWNGRNDARFMGDAVTCKNCGHNHKPDPDYCIARLQERIEMMERVRDTHLKFIKEQGAVIESLQRRIRIIDGLL